MAKSITYSVYRIFCAASSLNYVGQSRSPQRRLRAHFTQLRAGIHKNLLLQEAFDIHGEHSFQTEILESGIPASKIAIREKTWIAQYGGYETGYNLSRGGESNVNAKLKPSRFDPGLKSISKTSVAQRGYIDREVENNLDD